MTQYINPPDSVKKGRRLNGNTFQHLNVQLKPNEVLAGLFDRIIFKNAPIIANERDFTDFYDQYRSGQFISAEFYALPKDNHERV